MAELRPRVSRLEVQLPDPVVHRHRPDEPLPRADRVVVVPRDHPLALGVGDAGVVGEEEDVSASVPRPEVDPGDRDAHLAVNRVHSQARDARTPSRAVDPWRAGSADRCRVRFLHGATSKKMSSLHGSDGTGRRAPARWAAFGRVRILPPAARSHYTLVGQLARLVRDDNEAMQCPNRFTRWKQASTETPNRGTAGDFLRSA